MDERKRTCPQYRTSITPKEILKLDLLYLSNYIKKTFFLIILRKLYLLEPLYQTQVPISNHDSSELLNRLEIQETKVLECEQRCRKVSNDLQKVNNNKKKIFLYLIFQFF